MIRKNYAGMRFGRFTAVAPCHLDGRGAVVWELRCDCGETRFRVPANLGKAVSCGCFRSECSRQSGYAKKVRIGQMLKQWNETGSLYGSRQTEDMQWDTLRSLVKELGPVSDWSESETLLFVGAL